MQTMSKPPREKSHGSTPSPARATPLPRVYGTGTHYIGREEEEEVLDVIRARSPFRFYGENMRGKCEALEALFRSKTGMPYALAVSSGSAALITAFNALGIGPGDEVILPGYAWLSCHHAIVWNSAMPVLAEMDRSLSIDAADVERLITPRTKAILVVHFQGACAEMRPLVALAQRRKLWLVEDVAQSCGATLRGKMAGSFGDASIFSFQINKVITSGEGGLCLFRRAEHFKRAVMCHDLGLSRPVFEKQVDGAVVAPFPGNQFRMNELTGAFALAQARKLDRIVRETRNLYFSIFNQVKDLPGIEWRHLPDPKGIVGLELRGFFATPEETHAFGEAMQREGVPLATRTRTDMLHLQPSVMSRKGLHDGRGALAQPVMYRICHRTEELVARHFSLPIHPCYTARDCRDIVTAFRRAHQAVIG